MKSFSGCRSCAKPLSLRFAKVRIQGSSSKSVAGFVFDTQSMGAVLQRVEQEFWCITRASEH